MTPPDHDSEIGYFGNIWLRQNKLYNKGDSQPGHKHKFDHVTLLIKGSMSVEVEGYEPKKFTTASDFLAPTFAIIRKEHNHKITALEDNTVYYCVFAVRDINGEIVDDIYGYEHDPMLSFCAPVPDDYWDKLKNT